MLDGSVFPEGELGYEFQRHPLEEFASYSGDAYQTFMGRCVSTSGLSIEISPPVLIAYSG